MAKENAGPFSLVKTQIPDQFSIQYSGAFLFALDTPCMTWKMALEIMRALNFYTLYQRWQKQAQEATWAAEEKLDRLPEEEQVMVYEDTLQTPMEEEFPY